MSAPQVRILVIAAWVTVVCITFVWIGSVAARSWLLLFVAGAIPPAMLLWLWNEDRPQLLGALSDRDRRR